MEDHCLFSNDGTLNILYTYDNYQIEISIKEHEWTFFKRSSKWWKNNYKF